MTNVETTARQVLASLGTGGSLPAVRVKQAGQVPEPGRFAELLEAQVNRLEGGAGALGEGSGLKFSRHAQKRLVSRNINLSDADLGRLQDAVDMARRKGGRDSLVLLGDLALVVSVRSGTVITAVDGGSREENVFTNIDSAVIAR
jgi:flagellar operon protein